MARGADNQLNLIEVGSLFTGMWWQTIYASPDGVVIGAGDAPGAPDDFELCPGRLPGRSPVETAEALLAARRRQLSLCSPVDRNTAREALDALGGATFEIDAERPVDQETFEASLALLHRPRD